MNIQLREIFLALALASVGSWAFAQQTASSNWVPLGLEYEKVTTLVLDERVPGTLLAGSESDFSAGSHGGVFRTSNEGATWDTLLRGYSILSIVTHPVSSDTIFVCTGTANYSTSGILKSTDRGETWAWWDQGIFLNPETSVNSLAIDPSTPSVMYAGTGGFNGGSLFKSTDAGGSWRFLNPPDDNSFSEILVQPDAGNNLLVATTGLGRILRSTDAGESWSVQLDTIDQVLSMESTMAGRIVCVGFGRYWHYKYGRSTDYGVTWSEFSMVDSVNRGLFSLALSSTDPDIVFTVTAGPNNHVYRSFDGGKVW
ncbi:MAG: hypothetical protein IT282_07580, partial [Bacteroidetes bacterium]|nr:hypothetical protein [Bacteroidota bacterium]